MLLDTVKLKMVRYLLPSLRVKRVALEVVVGNGIGKTTSVRPGEMMDMLKTFTSTSFLSDSYSQTQ